MTDYIPRLTNLTATAVPVLGGATAVLTLIILVLAYRIRAAAADLGESDRLARRSRRARRVDALLTAAAAGIATVVSAQGMLRVFQDRLHLTGGAQYGTFAFLEIAMLAEANRARRNLREFGSTGVDGAAVWVIAVVSGLLSATDARNPTEALLRLAAPLLAGWLWERSLAPERRRVRGDAGAVWRFIRTRVLVALRLAAPPDGTVADYDRARRVARLARLARRYHTLRDREQVAAWLVAWAGARYDRALLRATERVGLGTDPAVRESLLTTLAVLSQARDQTSPAALAARTPWAPEPADDRITAAVDALEQRLEQWLEHHRNSNLEHVTSELESAVRRLREEFHAALEDTQNSTVKKTTRVLEDRVADAERRLLFQVREALDSAPRLGVVPPAPNGRPRQRDPERTALVKRIMEVDGCSPQTAYNKVNNAKQNNLLDQLKVAYSPTTDVGEGP